MKQQVCALAAESLSDNVEDENTSASSIASATLSAAFLSYLVNSEKAQKVLDLIKLDNEKDKAHPHHRAHSSGEGASSAQQLFRSQQQQSPDNTERGSGSM
jgi:hypothetical protein